MTAMATAGGGFKENFKKFIDQFGVSSDDLKNLTVSALLIKMMNQSDHQETKTGLKQLLNMAQTAGLDHEPMKNMKF